MKTRVRLSVLALALASMFPEVSQAATGGQQTQTFANGSLPTVCAADVETGGACFDIVSGDCCFWVEVSTYLESPYGSSTVPFSITFTDEQGTPFLTDLSPQSVYDRLFWGAQYEVYDPSRVFCGPTYIIIPAGARRVYIDPKGADDRELFGDTCLGAETGRIFINFSEVPW